MGPQTARKRAAPSVERVSGAPTSTLSPVGLAALFDVDGVIADTARLHTAAWARLASEEGLPFPQGLADQLRGVSREDSLRRILGGRRISESDFTEFLRRKNGYYLSMVEEITHNDLLPGAWQVINGMRLQGLTIAAVSASRNARRVLERLGILPGLDLVVDGNDPEATAHHQNRFRIAARRLGVPPQDCLVFEDSASAIQMARELGMKTVALGVAAQAANPDLHFESLCGVDARLVLKWLHCEPTVEESRISDPLAMAGAI